MPGEQLRDAVAAGGIPGVKFQAPDGSTRYVPANRTHEAYAAGGTMVPIKDQEIQHPGFWSTMYSDLKGMASGLNPVTKLTETKQDLIDQQRAEDAAEQSPERMAHGWTYRNLTVPAAETVGVNVSGMEQSAAEGDVGGVGGHAAAPAAAALITHTGAKIIGGTADTIRKALDTPEAQAGVGAATKAVAKAIPKALIRRIPYVGDVAADAYRAGKTAYQQASAANPSAPSEPGYERYAPNVGGPETTPTPAAPEPTPAPAPAAAAQPPPVAAQPVPAAVQPEATASPSPEAAADTPSAARASRSAAPTVAQESTPPPARTIVRDPETGQEEFSDVIKAKLAARMQSIQAEEAAAKASPASNQDLLDQLQASLEKAASIKAQKNAGVTLPDSNTPRFVYRARDFGEEGVPLKQSHAQAGSNFDRILQYAEPGQRGPDWGQVIRIDLSKLDPKDFVAKAGPTGETWVQFKRPLSENEVTPMTGQNASAK